MNYQQIAIFFLQATLVASLILFLFRLRKNFGIGLLFAGLGLLQFMQVFLSSTIYVSITSNLIVSPGSSVLFTVTLFAVLLIYIKEDASETRKLIYALFIINMIMSLLLLSFSWNVDENTAYNPFNVSTNLFNNNSWVLIVGTITLIIDSLLIIIIYEFISRYLAYLFLRIAITMLIVITFDTFFFSTIAFWDYDNLYTIIKSGLISKGVFTIYYSLLFSIYLKYIETKNYDSVNYNIKDVFQTLTYRQKYEVATQDVIKASEEVRIKEIKYQTLTNISPVGIFHTRSDGYTTFVNPRWCEISGMEQKEALGDGWFHAVHVDDRPRIKEGWDLAVSSKSTSKTDYRFILSDGSIRWVLGQASPELNIKNEIIGFIGTITDITELKLFQEEQIRLRKKADESNQLKSAFLANMSHEIRTPMNGILGFSDLLKEPGISGDEQNRYIEIIQKSGTRMLNIINDIISISKIEADVVELNLQALDINKHLDYIYNFHKSDAESKGLLLNYIENKTLSHLILITDEEKFSSILTNLIFNAIKYTEKGSISFGYHIEGPFIKFYVKDTGIGIDKNRQKAIFERFIQADIEDKMARQGAGLGLAISKAYIEMLGGTIGVESALGLGSAFHFTIPYNVENIDTKKIDSPNKNEKLPAQSNHLKILIVEDHETSFLLIEILLESIDCEILQAKNGLEAVEICKNDFDIDLILMDIKLPILSGYEATKQIREFNKDVIIIAQTAYALTGDKERSLEVGCNEHLPKPIIKEVLFELIQEYFPN